MWIIKQEKQNQKNIFPIFQILKLMRSEYKKLLLMVCKLTVNINKSLKITKKYDEKYSLAADLDFYLKTTKLLIQKLNYVIKILLILELVCFKAEAFSKII